MRYYRIGRDFRYAKLVIRLDMDRYRELACQMTFGRSYQKGQPFPEGDILAVVEQTLDKNWRWEEDPRRKGPPPHPSIARAGIDYAFDPAARNCLAPLLESCGGWIGISQEGANYDLFIVTTPYELEAPVPECPHFFKGNGSGGTFVSETFREIYLRHALTGLKFYPVDEQFEEIRTPRKPIDLAARIQDYQNGTLYADQLVDLVADVIAQNMDESFPSKFARLPKEIRVFWAAWRYYQEFGNGSMEQTFVNIGHFLPFAEAAYRTLGHPEAAQAIATQIKLLKDAGVTLRRADDFSFLDKEIQERIEALWESDDYPELDAEYELFECTEDLANYVVAHPQRFIERKQ